ncbi:MAG: hypothetical protein R3B47_03010 [Bacteroidia bacterium]
MKINLPVILLAGLVLFQACGSASKADDSKEATVVVSDELNNEGLSFAVLGAPIDSMKLPADATTEEELVSQEGYQWRVLTVFLPDGRKAIIEGDFVDEGDPGGKLRNSNINRVQVDGPDWQSPEGIRVGQSLEDLVQAYGDSALMATWIPDYEVIDVSLPGISRIHYNLSDPSGKVAGLAQNNVAQVGLSEIPMESNIVSIVISF